MHNLANGYALLGRSEEAREMHKRREALGLKGVTFSRDHPLIRERIAVY